MRHASRRASSPRHTPTPRSPRCKRWIRGTTPLGGRVGTGSWHLWGFSRDRGGRVVDGLAHDRCWSRRNAVTMLCSAVPSPGTLGGLVVPRSGTGAGPNSGVAVGAKAPPCRALATLLCPFKLDRDTVRRPGAEAPRLEECAPGPAARESPATVPSTTAVGPADPMPLYVDGTHNNDEHQRWSRPRR